jgi:16S rRNA (cytosine1402-N4)-methyltransferase
MRPERHKSVLLQETIELLDLKEGSVVVDGTVGAGGHSEAILRKIGEKGMLIGIDQDQTALDIAKNKFKSGNFRLIKGNFSDIKKIIQAAGIDKVDAILLDLGVSSMQLDEGERGFSFSKSAPLDMRMDQASNLTASEIVNTYTESELTKIFRDYGEEEQSKSIAKRIVEVRVSEPIVYTDQLAEVVRGVKGPRGALRVDPATKVFQALRIEVNKELLALQSALPQLVELLKSGGRFAIISFHSLEDRIVKKFINYYSEKCHCPPENPICNCKTVPVLKKITKKAVVASREEQDRNPRARSAKLRVAEKI